MTIITGGAHSASGHTQSGDQTQSGTPDYKGEVSLRKYQSEASFKGRYGGFTILRPKDASVAAKMAELMIVACNNRHIGYLYGGKGMKCQGGSNTVDTSSNCVTDCSGLVGECASEATGKKIYAATSGMISTYTKSGFFVKIGLVSSRSLDSIYNGDVLVRPGNHTDLVVSGNPRKGTTDENIGSTSGSGDGLDSDGSGSTDAMQGVRAAYEVIKTFEPRRKAPVSTEKGYEYYQQKNGTTENGSYAWGRFSEAYGKECTLSKGNPRRWFLNTEDGYKRGVSPSLGAVMCFTNVYKSSDPGYVCIVENITSNSIYISDYSLGKSSKFEYIQRRQRNGSWDLDLDGDGKYEYMFQGFIYSPAVDDYFAAGSDASAGKKSYLTTFIDTARGQVGEGSAFTKKYGGIVADNESWSGGFIRAVAARSGGILGVIIPDTSSCSSIGTTGVAESMGEWIDGPYFGGKPHPQLGDIVLFRMDPKISYRLKYGADKAGIVVSVDSEGASVEKGQVIYNFKVVMGDCGGKVSTKNYSNTTPSLSGIFRPDWSQVDTIALAPETMTSVYGMYVNEATIEDAAIRDLKYISTSLKPSIKSTGLKLSAINYTGMLANLYGAFAEMSEYIERRDNQSDYLTILSQSAAGATEEGASTAGINTGNDVKLLGGGKASYVIQNLYGSGTVNKVVTADSAFKTIYATLKDFLGNRAGAIGIMGNIEIESGHSTSAGDAAGAIGICQWMGDRKTNMIKTCGGSWKNNLSGQLQFLMKELSGGSSSVKKTCMGVPDTLSGAYQASDAFMKGFERPDKQEINGPNRRKATFAVWTLILGGGKES